MPILKKNSKYERELNEARIHIKNNNLPYKINTDNVSGFRKMLRFFLRRKGLSDDITTSTDPDKDGVWINRRRK